jgi:autotransporter-associated beta strand protein
VITLALVVFGALVPVASAADSTWVDGTGNWSNTANWLGTVPNAIGDIARLNVTGTATITLDTGFVTLGSLFFNTTDQVTLAGTNNLILQAVSGSALVETDGPGVTDVISAPLTLGSNTTFLINSAGLTLNGTVTGNNSTLTKMGAGTLTINGSAASAYNTVINVGTVTLGNINVLSTGAVTVNSGGTLNVQANNNVGVLNLTSGQVTGAGTLTLNAAVTSLGSSTIASGVALNTTQTVTVSSGELTISGALTGTGTLTKAGNSDLILSNAGTNLTGTGGINVTAGSLQINASGMNVGRLNQSNTTLINVNGNLLNTTFTGPTAVSNTAGIILLGGGTLAVGFGNATDTTNSYYPTILDSGVFAKVGTGTVQLGRIAGGPPNTGFVSGLLGGTIKVMAGTLVFTPNNSDPAPINASVFVASGATFGKVGQNQQISIASLTGDGNVTSGQGNMPLYVGNDNSSFLWNGVIGTNMGLNKRGSGTMTITNNNTFPGQAVVYAGIMNLDGGGRLSGYSTLQMYNGILNLINTGTNSADRINANDMAFNASGTLNLIGNASAATTEASNNVSVAFGFNTIGVSSNNANPASSATLTLGNWVGRTTNQGGWMDINLTGTAANVTFNTAASGTNGILNGMTIGSDWATNTGANGNTVAYSSYSAFATGNNPTQNQSLLGSGSLSGTSAVNTLKIDTNGTGQGLNLNGFALSASTIGTPTALLFVGSNNYTISGAAGSTIGSASLTATSAINTSDVVIVNKGSGQLNINVPLNGTLATSSSGSVTFAGNGTTVLGAVSNYTGKTFIDSGTVRLGVANALNATGTGALTSSSIYVFKGANLDMGGFSMTTSAQNNYLWGGNIIGAGTLTIENTANDSVLNAQYGNSTISVNTLNLGNTMTQGNGKARVFNANDYSDILTISSKITGSAYSVQFGGEGTVVLSGKNNFNTTVTTNNDVRVVVQNNYALGNTTYGTTISTTNALILQDISGLGLRVPEPITINGSGFMYEGTGALRNVAGINGGINNNTLSNTITLADANNNWIGVDTGTTLTITGQLTGNQPLQKIGGGTLILSNPANNWGNAKVTSIIQGTIQNGDSDVIGNVANDVQINSGATYDLNGYTETIHNLGDFNGGSGTVSLGNGGDLTLNQGANWTYSGNITGTNASLTIGNEKLLPTAAYTWTLAGQTNFTGVANVTTSATLAMGANDVFTAGNTTVNLAGGTFDLIGFSTTVGRLTGTGVVTSSNTAGYATLTLNETGSSSYAGALTGTLALVKTGAGTVTLNNPTANASTYTGTTQVLGGILQLGASDQIPDASILTIGGGTLDRAGFNETVGQFFLNGGSVTGAGTLTVGDIVATGTNSISGGTLNLGAGAGARTLNIVNGTTTIADATTNAATLNKAGAGTLILSSGATFTGTNILAGAIQEVGGPNRIGTGALLVSTGATLDLNGQSQQVAGVSGSGTVNSTTSGGALTTTVAAGTQTFTGLITGQMSLTKAGAGTQALTKANTYTGGTTISAGTMLISNTSGSAFGPGQVTLNAGTIAGSGLIGGNVLLNGGLLNSTGTISANVSGGSGAHLIAAGSLNTLGTTNITGSLTLNKFSTLDFQNMTNLTTHDLIKVTGSLAFSGTGQSTLVLPGFGIPQGTLNLIQFGSTALANASNFAVQGGLLSGMSLNMTTTALQLTYIPNEWITGGASTRWNDAANWSIGIPDAVGSAANFLDHGSPAVSVTATATVGTIYYETTVSYTVSGASSLTMNNGTINARIIMAPTTTANQTISTPLILAGLLQLTNATAAQTLTLAGGISGGFGVTVDSGTVVLATSASTYTGATTLTGATAKLQLAASNLLPDVTAVSISGGAALDLQTNNDTVASLSLAGGSVLGSGTLTTTSALDMQSGTVQAHLAGSVGLLKTTSGLVALTGTASYTGATNVSVGTLQIGINNALPATTDLTVSDTFDMQSNSNTVSSLTLTGGTVLGSGSATLTATSAAANSFNLQSGRINAKLASSGGLSKTTSGTVVLAGSGATYAGATSITNGTLQLAANSAVANTALTLTNATLDVQSNNNTVASLTMTGGTILGTGTLTATSLALDTGFIYANLTSPGTPINKSTSGILALLGTNTTGSTTTVSNGTLRLGGLASLPTGNLNIGNGNFETQGTISRGPGTLTGQIQFTGTGGIGAFGGLFTLNLGPITWGVTGFVASGTPWILGTPTANNQLVVPGGINLNGITQTVVVNPGAGGDSVSLNGPLTNGGLNKDGLGILLLGSTGNTYSGDTTVLLGTLKPGIAGGTSPNSSLTVNSGAFFDVNNLATTVAGLNNNGTLILTGTGALTFGGNNADGSINGSISGAGSLVKTGTGNYTAAPASVAGWTGTTGINGGQITLGVPNALPSVTVNTGGTLNRNSFDMTAALSLAGGTVSGAGTITLNANPTWTGGTLTGGALNLGGTRTITVNTGTVNIYDQITGAGALTVNGSGTLLFYNTANNWTNGLTVGGANFTNGASNVIPDGLTVTVNSTWNLNGFYEKIAALADTTSTVNLGSGTLEVATFNTSSFILAGTGTFIVDGGTGITNGNAWSAFTGILIINSGANLRINHGGTSVGKLAAVSDIYINAGGSLQVSCDNLPAGVSPINPNVRMHLVGGTYYMDDNINHYDNNRDQTLGVLEGYGMVSNNSDDTAHTLTINQTSGTYTYSGQITNNAFALSLTKSGAGTWVLNNTSTAAPNNYTGTTKILGGTLQLGANEQIPDGSALTINGATLDRGGFTETVGALTMGNGTVLGAGQLILSGDLTTTGASSIAGGTLNLNSSGTRTFNVTGTLNLGDASIGAVSITKTGAGTLIVSSPMAVALLVKAGAVQNGASEVFSDTANFSVDSGTTWNLAGNTETINYLIGSGGTVSLGGGALILGSANNPADNFTFSGPIQGAGTLTKNGSGSQTLTGLNTYTGLTTINNGTLAITTTAGLGTGAGGTQVNGGTLAFGGGLTMNGNALALNGAGYAGGGALRSTSGANAWNATITLGSSSTIAVDANSLAVNAITGTGTLTKIGAGTLTLNATASYDGGTNINGGTLAITLANALPSTTAVSISNGATLAIGANNNDIASLTLVSGAVTGTGILTASDASATAFTVQSGTVNAGLASTSGGLTKNTGGTVTLTNTSTYGGPTTIDAGTLAVNTLTGSGTVTLNAGHLIVNSALTGGGDVTLNGGTLTSGGTITGQVLAGLGAHTIQLTGNLSVGNLTLSKQSSLVYSDLNVTPNVLASTGTLSFSGTGAASIFVPLIVRRGDTNLITFTSTPATTANFQIANGYTGLTLNMTTTSLVINYVPNEWTANGATTNWTDSNNWTISVPNGVGERAGFLSLATTSATPGAVTVNSAVTVGVITFDGTANYTLSGGGTLTLNNGTNGDSLIYVASTSANAVINAPIALNTTNLLIRNDSATNSLTISGGISGSGRSVTLADGTLILSGSASTYNGGTTLNGGSTLKLGASELLANTGDVTINDGSTFNLQGNTETIATLNLNSGTVTDGGIATGKLIVSGVNALQGLIDVCLNDPLASLTKTGTGTLILNKSAGYTGGTNILGGTIQVTGANFLPTVGLITIDNGSTLDVGANAQTIAGLSLANGTLAGSGPLTSNLTAADAFSVQSGVILTNLAGSGAGMTKSGPGTVLLSALAFYGGDTTITNGILQLGGMNYLPTTNLIVSGGTLDMQGYSATVSSLVLNGTITGAGNFLTVNTLATLQSGSFTGVMDGAASVVKNTTGTLTFNGANAYTGTTTINNGILAISNSAGIGTNNTVLVNNGGTLALSGNITMTKTALTLNGAGFGGIGALDSVSGTNVWSGGITLGSASTIGVDANQLTVGAISGTGPLTKVGSGTLVVGGTGSYTGGTTISNGILKSNTGNALPTATTLTVGATGTFDMNGRVQTLGGLTGSGIVTQSNTAAAQTLTLNSAGTDFSGRLTGSLNLAINSGYTQTLSNSSTSAVNNYSGSTTIGGTLILGANNQITSGSATTITGTLDRAGFSQTLSGTLTLNGGSVIGAGTLVRPGDLSITGNVLLSGGTLDMGSALRVFTVNGTDTLTINDAIIGGGALQFNKLGTGTLVLSNSANAFNLAGNSQIGAGTVRNTGDNSTGHGGINLADGALWDLNHTFQTVSGLDNVGTVTGTAMINLNGGTLLLNNWGNSYAGQITSSGGTLIISTTQAGAPGQTLNYAAGYNIDHFILRNGSVQTSAGSSLTSNDIQLENGTVNIPLNGTNGINKTTSGRVILNSTNLYSGQTLVSNGVLQLVDTGSAIPAGSNINLAGGILQINNTNTATNAATLARNLSSGGGGDIQFTGSGGGFSAINGYLTVTLNGGTVLQFGSTPSFLGNGAALGFGSAWSNNVTELTNGLNFNGTNQIITVADNTGSAADYTLLSGVLSNGALTKMGNGLLVISNSANSYTLGTTVLNGTLALGANDVLGTGPLTVNGGTFDLAGFNLSATSLTLNAGNVVGAGLLTAGTIEIQSGVVSASLSGTGGLSKTTTGAATLSGANTYTGVTNVNLGTLLITNGQALGSSADGTVVANGAALQIANSITVLGEHVTINGAGPDGTGVLRNMSGLNSLTGPVTLASASTIGVDSGALTLSGQIGSTGTYTLTKTGVGTLLITNTTNNYTGDTNVDQGLLAMAGSAGVGDININSSGTLQIQRDGFNIPGHQINLNPNGILEIFKNVAATINLAGGTVASHGNVTASGSIIDGADTTFVTNGKTLTLSHNFALTNNRTYTVGTGDTVVLSGNITGTTSAGNDLTKKGPGTLMLEGTNTFNHITVGGAGAVIGGYLVATTSASVPSASGKVIVYPGSLYSVSVTNHNYNEVDLSQSRGVLGLSAPNNATLNFDNTAGSASSLSLGAYTDSTFTGTLKPDWSDGAFTYVLGGGPATLTIGTSLNNYSDAVPAHAGSATNMQIGWQGDTQDPLPKGLVLLSAVAHLTGSVDVYGNMAIATSDVLPSASSIKVWQGGSFDLNHSGFIFTDGRFTVLPAGGSDGGSIANSGGSLNQADLTFLFTGGSNYKLGGGNPLGTTTITDSALSNLGGTMGLMKLGSDNVVLADAGGLSGNTLNGTVTLSGGTLTVPDISSIGTTSSIRIDTTGMLNLTGSGNLAKPITMADSGVIRVTSGKTISATSLSLDDITTTSAVLTGGGTLALTASDAIAHTQSTGTGILNVQDSSTLSIPWTLSTIDPGRRLAIRDTGTLLFSSTATSNTHGNSIGSVYAGGTIKFANDLATGNHLTMVRDTTGGVVIPILTFDVDPADYLAQGTGAFSSPAKPYTFDVGNNQVNLTSTTSAGVPVVGIASASFQEGALTHRPVAYIKKLGSGTLLSNQAMLANGTPDTRLFAWDVEAGTLQGQGFASSLGATAYSWVTNGQPAAFVQQHLEGIIVAGGATLSWSSTQGFLPSSAYGGLLQGEGDGWNAGEFVMGHNSTLMSSSSDLVLGFQYTPPTGPAVNYAAYPTIKRLSGGDPAIPTLNVGGNVAFHSGIQVDPVTVPSGQVDINVAPISNVTFANNISGVGYAGVHSLTLQSSGAAASNATVSSSFANTQTTTIQNAGILTLDPGASTTISYAGNVSLNGTVHVKSGTVQNMGVISSSSPGLIANAGLLKGMINQTQGNNAAINMASPTSNVAVPDLSDMDAHFGSSAASGGVWPQEGMDWVYTGQFFQAATGPVTFAKNFDDGIYLAIDGSGVAGFTGAWNFYIPSATTLTLNSGWHNFEARFRQDAGGVGPTAQGGFDMTGKGLGWNSTGANSLVDGSIYSTIPGSLFQYLVAQGMTTIDAGSELQASGFQTLYQVNNNGTLTLTGTVANTTMEMTLGNSSVLNAQDNTSITASTGITLGAAAINVASGKTLTVNGTMANIGGAGTGSINKTGAGTLTLSGSSSYSGATTVNNGTLRVNGSIASSAVTVHAAASVGGTGTVGTLTLAGGTLRPGTESTVGTLTAGAATFQGGSTYLWRISNAALGTADRLTVNGGSNILDLTGLSPGNPMTILITSLGSIGFNSATNYEWVLASADTISGFSDLNFTLDHTTGFAPNIGTGSFSIITTGSIGNMFLDLVFTTGVTPTWTWTGVASTEWTTSGNWLAGSPPPATDTAIFSGALTANQPTLTSGQAVGGLDFESTGWSINGTGQLLTINSGGLNSSSTNAGVNTIHTNVGLGASQQWNTDSGNTVNLTGTLTLNGNTLTKVGAGTVQLGGTGGTGSGTLLLNNGMVQLTASNVLGDSVYVNVNGGTFAIGGNSDTVGTVDLTDGTISGSGGTLTATGGFRVYNGVVSAILGGGSANLTKSGAGTVVLNAVNTYGGGGGTTTIAGGILQINTANSLPTGTSLAVNAGTFDMNNHNQTVAQISGSGSVALGSGTLSVGGNNASTTFAGPISGTGGLSKTGTGTLILSSTTSNFSGPVSLTGGALSVSHQNNLGNDSVTNALSIDNNAALKVTGTFSTARPVNVLAGGATVNVDGSQAVTFTGALAVKDGATLTKTGGGTMTINGTQNWAADDTNLVVQTGAVNMGSDPGSDLVRNLNVTLNGTSTMVVSNTATYLKALTLNGTSQMTIASSDGTGGNKVLVVGTDPTSTLNFAGGDAAPTALLEINNNTAIIRNNGTGTSTMKQVQNLVVSAQGSFNGETGYFNYDGKGITSSAVAADQDHFGIGVIDNSFDGLGYDFGWGRDPLTEIKGVPVALNDTIAQFTTLGDMNLDGKTDLTDYFAWKFYYVLFNNPNPDPNIPPLTVDNIGWQTGDFNMDGSIDLTDYFMWKAGYVYSNLNGPLSGGDVTALEPIPEPTTLVLLAAGGLLALARKRRRSV